MSYAEILCEKSLRLICENHIKIIRNYRPDWLKNPLTGKNLEIDFYLPHIPLAIEIQGEHHYSNENQIKNDKIKEDLLRLNKILLLKLSIFQISPHYIYRKISKRAFSIKRFACLNKYNNEWNNLSEYKEYKRKILEQYGLSKCNLSPFIHEQKEKRKLYFDNLDKKIMLNVEYEYLFKNSGITVRVTPVKVISLKEVECRILGSDKFLVLKKEDLGSK